MRLVIQRVTQASVTIDGVQTASIGRGYLVLFGAGEGDTEEMAERLADKLVKLRINADPEGKTNLSLLDIGGSLLVVSQFTLYADCRKGNRPSFTKAGSPERAKELYLYFVKQLRTRIRDVQTGTFGAKMEVSLCNDGPFTILLEA